MLSETRIHFESGRFALALEGYRDLLQRGDRRLALNGVAASYAMLGRPDLAERYFQQALAVAPGDSRTLNNLGNFYLNAGRADVALVYLAEARAAAEPEIGRVAALNYARAEAAIASTDQPGHEEAVPPGKRKSQDVDSAWSARVEVLSAHVQHVQLSETAAPGTGPAARLLRRDEPEANTRQRRHADLRLVVSNGAGMRHMARLFGGYLARDGWPTPRLANAEHFRHQETVLFYRPEALNAARRLRSRLSVTVRLERRDDLDVDVRLRLGGDLVPTARRLLVQEAHA